MQQNTGNFSMEEAMRFVNSPAGQQLLALLQRSNSKDLQKAMELAVKGELSQAKDAMKGILQDPQVQRLLKKTEE